eukprot:scaffold112315_cov17-Prasinocladus_malaysianus.AAC.1
MSANAAPLTTGNGFRPSCALSKPAAAASRTDLNAATPPDDERLFLHGYPWLLASLACSVPKAKSQRGRQKGIDYLATLAISYSSEA